MVCKYKFITILQGIGHSRPVRFRILTSELMDLFRHLVWLLGREISPVQGVYLHISMPRAVLEPAIPVFEPSKTVRALDREAIRTGYKYKYASYTTFVW